MKLTLRADSVEIEGYVNAIERNSKPLFSRIGKFIERICTGAFKKALNRNDDVHILLNHDWNRDLGSTKQGNLELHEDNIGLHARATITDADVVKMARNGELVGWSFGFQDRDVENSVERGMPLREVKDLDLFEVSILNRSMTPAYDGTLVSARSIDGGEEQVYYRGEDTIEEVTIEGGEQEEQEEAVETRNTEKDGANSQSAEEEPEKATDDTETPNEEKSQEENQPVENNVEKSGKIDYSEYKTMIKEMKEE